MRWKNSRRSKNVEDRRGQGGSGGRGGMKMPSGIMLIVVLVGALVFKVDPQKLLGLAETFDGGGAQAPATTTTTSAASDELTDFSTAVLGETEDVWNAIFEQSGQRYDEPRLVVFSDATNSGCGFASSATGPFYCSADKTIYLDVGFFDDLRSKYGAPGDFAAAYVIAHEVGHHVQYLLGISDDVRSKERVARSEADKNELSVRQELQADFLAGLWAHHAERARGILEEGDIEEALGAASAIGDDRLQKQARGYVTPDSFTHGTSAQRQRWFMRGLKTGDFNQGDTYSIPERDL